MTEVTLVKRSIILGILALALMVGAVACTKEKPLDLPTPVIAQGITPIPGAATPAASAAAATPVTAVPGPTETPGSLGTLVVPLPSLLTPTANLATPTPGASLAGTATTYTVQPGDWMRRIAEKHGITVEALTAANPGINPDMIYPGQVLKIPAASSGVTTPSTTSATLVSPAGAPTTYTVQQGEWFYQIARKFGLSVVQLQAANPGINPNFLSPGQVLNIPGSVAPSPTP